MSFIMHLNIPTTLLIFICYLCGCHLRDVFCQQSPIKRLNKYPGSIKTYENKYGEIFDCVTIYQQPAFNHPLLRNHTVQIKPSKELFKNIQCPSKRSQAPNERDHGCPKGTVPVKRTYKYDIVQNSLGIDKNIDPKSVEYANVGTTKGRHLIFGATAVLDIWNPHVSYLTEYSLAKVSLTTGDQSIEAGWKVSNSTRENGSGFTTTFYIRWKTDMYGTAGCFNLECPGFIVTNNQFEIGGTLQSNDPMGIYIYREFGERKWWLLKDCEVVGYWPINIIPRLAYGATQATFGGEVLNRRINRRHTSTQMGNGLFGASGGSAASIHSINVAYNTADNDIKPKPLREYEINMNKPHCYNAEVENRQGQISLYYGGPGYTKDNLKCNHWKYFDLD